MKNIIVDIDGTIAEPGDRLKYLKQSPKDWDSFYAACFDDEPIEPIIDIVERYTFTTDYKVVFCTGRRESVREQTLEWIDQYIGMPMSGLDATVLRRPDKDHRHDTVVKPEQLEKEGITPENTRFILEDRDSMVKKWRELGFTCLQVREGNF